MSEGQEEKKGVGGSVPLLALVAGVVAVVVLGLSFYLFRMLSTDESYGNLIIATGPDTGAYHALGESLARVLKNKGTFDNIELRSTDGSAENMTWIASPQSDLDLAFVQGDASPSTNARLIATLFDEVLHILVSKASSEQIQSIYDLQGRRVTLGAAGSGTRELAARVLRHFGVKPGEDLLMTPAESAVALAEGEIDAAFLLTAIPSRLVESLAERDKVRFLSLGLAAELEGGEAHALELVFPGVKRDVIPRSTYVRLPLRAVHTVSVTAMLVARETVSDELVNEVTSIIFGNRSGASGLEGADLTVARKIREDYSPATVTIPYHPGAQTYYLREQPPFFVEYAEALSFGLTLLLAIYSIFIAVREWLRLRMKNRVDAYLLEVERTVAGEGLTVAALESQREDLQRLRRAAFDDLIEEKLHADEAFLILQNHLRDELNEIEVQLGVSREE